jgi:hypothetical protein
MLVDIPSRNLQNISYYYAYPVRILLFQIRISILPSTPIPEKCYLPVWYVDRDSVVGIETRYGPEQRGIESQ